MSDQELEAPVRKALRRVVDPCSIATGAPIDLVEMGLIERLEIDAGHVRVTLRLTSPICWQATNIVTAVEEFVAEVDGVEQVSCEIDAGAEWMPSMIDPRAQERLRRLRPLERRARGRKRDTAAQATASDR